MKTDDAEMGELNEHSHSCNPLKMETYQEIISPRWLTHRLRENGHLSQGEVRFINIKERHKHHCALNVTYSPDAIHSLPRDFILKYYDGGYPYGLREGLFFDQIVPYMTAPPVPTCFDAEINWETARAHVLLNDLSATHFVASPPYNQVQNGTFEQVVDAHAQIHAYWWDHPRINEEDIVRVVGVGVAHEAISPETIRQNEQYFAERALPTRVEQSPEHFPEERQLLCQRVITAWARLFIDRIADGHGLTLIQGDAQLGNLLLPRDSQRDRPIIIDWEGCIRGLGVWDLARTLIQTELPSDMRKKLEKVLLSRYQTRLAVEGIDYSIDECRADYRLCLLANIPHALTFESHSYLESAIRAFRDWGCKDLLD